MLPFREGIPVDKLVCIELCAGSARLSKTIKEVGFATSAIDHSRNRHKALHGITYIDLADDRTLNALLNLLDSLDSYSIFMQRPLGVLVQRRVHES